MRVPPASDESSVMLICPPILQGDERVPALHREASVLMSCATLAGVKRHRAAADDDDKDGDVAPDCAVCQACTTHFRPY